MILVNISAVCTSMTFTLMPVSASHFGPENFSGSRDCRPASQTTVIVWPRYFCASLTAVSAASSALAAPAQDRARTATAPIHVILLKRLIVSSQIAAIAFGNRPSPASGPTARYREFLFQPPASSRANAFGESLQPRFEARRFEYRTIDDPTRHATVLHFQRRRNVGGAVAGKALIGPAQRMGRQDHVVELQDRIGRIRRLSLQHVEPGAGDASFLQYLGQRLLVDDRPARRVD